MGGNGDSMKKINLLVALALAASVISIGAGADPIEEGRVKRGPVELTMSELVVEAVPEPVVAEGPRWTSEVEAIARVCVHEAGLEAVDDEGEPINDCGAIAQVARYHAERFPQHRGSAEAAIRGYSSRTFDRARTDGRRWVAWMTLDLAQPRGWSASMTWNPELWRAKLDEVSAVLAGTAPAPCPEPVFHWGGPRVDHERIERGIERGFWRRVDCGNTLNTFLAPRVMPAQLARGRQGDL